MAKRRYVNTVFWDDYYVSNLDPSEKLLFLYLITNPCTNIAGVYQITLKRIALDTGFEKEMVQKILDRFQKDGKILYSEGWISIKNFIKHQSFNSPQVVTGIEKELQNAPDEHKTWLRYPIDSLSEKHISLSLDKDLNQDKDTVKRFSPPSPDEVKEYLKELKNTTIDHNSFCDYYQSKGWMIGKNKMKDWKAAVRQWVSRDKKQNGEKKIWPEFGK